MHDNKKIKQETLKLLKVLHALLICYYILLIILFICLYNTTHTTIYIAPYTTYALLICFYLYTYIYLYKHPYPYLYLYGKTTFCIFSNQKDSMKEK
jgi:hypothetical protein